MCARTLRIRLFGELDLQYGEERLLQLESARASSLLAYLLLHRGVACPRGRVAFVLWPDSTDTQARTNLRHLLHTLRHSLPDAEQFFEVTNRTISLARNDDLWSDVGEIERAAETLSGEFDADDFECARRAMELYSGDLLEGCYDDWIEPERDRLRSIYTQSMTRVIDVLTERGQFADGIAEAERLLRHDPLNESCHRALMRLHDMLGNRAQALQQYHVLVATLDRELGVPPSTETIAAYQALLPDLGHSLDVDPRAEDARDNPFIGRLAERRRLTSLWAEVDRGGPRLVLLSGEAGVGKTRLAEDFLRWCSHHGAVTASARAFQAEGSLTYGPLISWLRSTHFATRVNRLDPAHSTHLARLLPELTTDGPSTALLAATPEVDQRRILFDAAASVISGGPSPVLLLADDLQWFDRETLQFLHYLIRRDHAARLMIVATLRADEVDSSHPASDLRAGIRSLDRLVEIDLDPLTAPETGALAALISGHALAKSDEAALYRETEGNPLFVIEAIRAGWQKARLSGGWTSSRVQEIVERRLLNLSVPAQELIGVAAVIGREFDSDVLAHASGIDEETLVAALDELWRRRLIRELGTSAYYFNHEKTREVAYALLSPAQRRHHHLHIASSLEYLHQQRPGEISVDIARHFEAANEVRRSINWYRRAAEDAQRVFATQETIARYSRALDLLTLLPANRERDVQELEILSALPAPLLARDAYASDRLFEIHARAHELSRITGVALTPPLLRSIAISSMTLGDFVTALEVGEELRKLGEDHADDVLLVEALYVLGIVAFWKGSFLEARDYFEQAVQRYGDDARPMHLLRYGQDPKVVCLSRLANTLWFLGRMDEANVARDAALKFAEEIEHPVSHATALVFAAVLALDMRDDAGFRRYLSALEVDTDSRDARQFRIARQMLTGFLDLVECHDGSSTGRLSELLRDREAIAIAPGNVWVASRILLAAYAVVGQDRTGLDAANLALEPDETGPWEAEVRRLRSGFLANLGAPAHDVEAELIRALEVARRQSAKQLELRVRTSLLKHYLQTSDEPAAGRVGVSLASLIRELQPFGSSQDLNDAQALLSSC
ncbi:MAG: BTAD domain-containing putative transcriptional regulator [Nitrolancea sp.]